MLWIQLQQLSSNKLNWLISRSKNAWLVNVVLITVLSLVGSPSGKARASEPLRLEHQVLQQWYQCGLNLMHDSGLTGDQHWLLPSLYYKASLNKDPRFMELLFQVIHVESRFRARSVSSAQAYGLMQMTSVAMTEANRQCGLPIISMDKLYDSYTNVKYGSCFLDYLLKQYDGDITKAVIAYNGGGRQVDKYLHGEQIAQETAYYVVAINRAGDICKQGTRQLGH